MNSSEERPAKGSGKSTLQRRVEYGLLALLTLAFVYQVLVMCCLDQWLYLPKYGTFDAASWREAGPFERSWMMEDLQAKLSESGWTLEKVEKELGPPSYFDANSSSWEGVALIDGASNERTPFAVRVVFATDDSGNASPKSAVERVHVGPVPSLMLSSKAAYDDPDWGQTGREFSGPRPAKREQ